MTTCSVCGGPLTPTTVREGQDYHAFPDECVEQLQKRIGVLEAALRPFAEAAQLIPGHPDESSVAWIRFLTLRIVTCIRAAAAAMEGK